MLKINSLSVRRGGRLILKNISLEFNKGEVVLIGGHNGAGKSMFLKAIFGEFESPPCTITHTDFTWPREIESKIKQGVFYMPQGSTIFPSLSVRDHVAIFNSGHDSTLSAQEVALAVGAPEEQVAGTLSLGQQKMLASLRLCNMEPTVVLLDEPIASLSPLWCSKVLNLIQNHSNRTESVTLLVEHNLAEAIHICDRVIIIRRGEIVFDETSDGIRADMSRLSQALLY